MKILIACEFSGTVRDAFTARGHNATSCDFLPTEKPGKHYTGDVRDILAGDWDLMIAHPSCRFLALSASRWMHDHWIKRKNKPNKWHVSFEHRKGRKKALEFFRLLLEAPIPRKCIENPMSIASRWIEKRTQEIHPWQFGHGERKTTWLWLRNLPHLKPTQIVDGREQRIWKASPGANRWKERSRTFPGIAEAMAEQWGNLPTQTRKETKK